MLSLKFEGRFEFSAMNLQATKKTLWSSSKDFVACGFGRRPKNCYQFQTPEEEMAAQFVNGRKSLLNTLIK
ncbi:hypothetical protein BH09VER1_BH09VER1_17880 [soil metagenome]